jgi:hypothetical protein
MKFIAIVVFLFMICMCNAESCRLFPDEELELSEYDNAITKCICGTDDPELIDAFELAWEKCYHNPDFKDEHNDEFNCDKFIDCIEENAINKAIENIELEEDDLDIYAQEIIPSIYIDEIKKFSAKWEACLNVIDISDRQTYRDEVIDSLDEILDSFVYLHTQMKVMNENIEKIVKHTKWSAIMVTKLTDHELPMSSIKDCNERKDYWC